MSADERKQLEENIVEAGGAREPLVVWLRDDYDYLLLDGHNRYEICTRLGLPFDIEELDAEIPDRNAAMDWIDRNQLGRRNLSKQDYTLLIGRRYNRAKRSDGGHGDQKSGGQSDRPKETAADKIAREHGIGEATVRRAGKLQAAAAKLGIEADIAAGNIKASSAKIVTAAATLPEKPTAEQREDARKAVATAEPRKGKRKQADKPTAGDTRRRNGRLAHKATLGLIAVRAAVEELAQTDSTFRDSTLAELQTCVKHLSQEWIAAKGKPDKRPPSDDLRALVVQRWEAMRLWGKHWGIADMRDVRRLFAEIIRDEQKQFDK